jgi:NADPH2:quinone reductase
LQEGDRVFFSGASGSYAEYVACESHSVFHLADRLSFAQGAALGVPYFTAYRAIFIKYIKDTLLSPFLYFQFNLMVFVLLPPLVLCRGKAKAGDRVLVHGASGAVGLAACQIAKAHGN